MNAEKLKRMEAQVRVGGAGTARRKKKVVRKTKSTEDTKLQQALRKHGLSPLGGVEEVNLFKEDGTVIHITNPRIQANLQAHTYFVSGSVVKKPLTELLPGILSQLGRDSLHHLQKASIGKPGSAPAASAAADADEIPELVGSFDS